MKRLLLVALLLLSCHKSDAQPKSIALAHDPLLQHHDIRLQSLPLPYQTPSAGNPPRVVRRPANAELHVPAGFRIALFAADVDDPRNMIEAPNGDVIVAQTAPGRLTIFRDENHDGVPEKRFTFATELNEPFGLAIHQDHLYVGNTDGIVRFPFHAGQTSASAQPEKIAPLPAGGHSTRNIVFNRDGSKMYVSIGSASNVSVEQPPRASITEYNPDGSGRRVFAFGLRNPVGLAWNPQTGALWTVVNERDGLGDDLVPDYATDIRPGAFYGWPFSYLGQNEDPRRKGERRDLVAQAVVPSVLIQAHSAPLGIAFYTGSAFPQPYRGAAFVALHGSWNRAQRTGYKIISIPFRDGKPAGGYDDFVVGWSLDPESREVWGRPVAVLPLRDGSLLIGDDGGNVIWRVTYGK